MGVSSLDNEGSIDVVLSMQNVQLEMMQILLELKNEVSCIRNELSILSKGHKVISDDDHSTDSSSKHSGVDLEEGGDMEEMVCTFLTLIFEAFCTYILQNILMKSIAT